MRIKLAVVVAVSGGLISACASTSDRIGASYVSPLAYADYDCSQIMAEKARISERAHQVAGDQNRQAMNEQVATSIGLFLFWPALFMLVGPDRRDELSNLKGRDEALSQAAIEKRCDAKASPKTKPDQKPKSAA